MKGYDVPEKVRDYVLTRECVTVEDLTEAFGISRISSKNYLSRLSSEKVIRRVSRGAYAREEAKQIDIKLSPKILGIIDVIEKRLFDVDFVIWGTELLAPYSHYALGRDVIFIECKKSSIEKIRDTLLTNRYQVISKLSRDYFIEIYQSSAEPIILQPRKEKYATLKRDRYRIPTFERIFVDLYYMIAKYELPLPPDEYGRILYNFLEEIGLNLSVTFRYASRRGIRDEIVILLFKFSKTYKNLKISEESFVGSRKRIELIEEIIRGPQI